MKATKIFGSEPITENETYMYENAIARYNLTFVSEPEIRTKYEIMCHDDQLVEAVSKELDIIENPQEYDLLDMTLCSFNVGELFGKIFYLSSYTIRIQLVNPNNGLDTHTDDSIQIPFFNMMESKRIIKGFNNFR